MGKRGRTYILTLSKHSKIIRILKSNKILCFKCNEEIAVGQLIKSSGSGSNRWYHKECYDKTRQ